MPARGRSRRQQIVKRALAYDPRYRGRERVRLVAAVTPNGFWIEGHVYPELRGRVIKTCFVRKLFVEGCLICYAPDATCARDAEGCGETKCRPYLRIELAYDAAIYTLDLGIGSAANFVRMEEVALASGQLIVDVPLRLTVASDGEGGDVRFECV